MKIHVGSRNTTKLQAVVDAVALYPTLFPDPEILGAPVSNDLFGHPKNLQETVEGAISRAKESFTDCQYSFGLEGGLLRVPHAESGYMETSVCAIYDGKEIFLGLGPAYEWPKAVTKMILEGKADASKAFRELGLTKYEKLGAMKGGITGFLTDQRATREDFMKASIIMALIRLEKKEIYRSS